MGKALMWLGSILGGVLLNIVGSVAGRALTALGIGVVTYAGLDSTLTFLRDAAFSNLGSLPSNVVGLLGVLKIGTSINIVASAYVVRMMLSGINSGTVKKWVKK